MVQECEASLALVAVLREKEKGAPALAMGGGACGQCRSERRHLPWWQCWGMEKVALALAMRAVRVGSAGV